MAGGTPARQPARRRRYEKSYLAAPCTRGPPCLSKGPGPWQRAHPATTRTNDSTFWRESCCFGPAQSACAWSICKFSATAISKQRAQRQQQRTTEVAAKRGVIYDRAGRELAMSISVDSVFAVPADIPDLAGNHIPDRAHHQGRSPGVAGQMPGRPHFLLGGAQSRRRNRRPHSFAESERHSLPERIEAVLSQA